MVMINRNPKWRLNDIVFIKTCAECGIQVEWQAANPKENDQNNFHSYLSLEKGWRMRNVGIFGFGGKEWVCERHSP